MDALILSCYTTNYTKTYYYLKTTNMYYLTQFLRTGNLRVAYLVVLAQDWSWALGQACSLLKGWLELEKPFPSSCTWLLEAFWQLARGFSGLCHKTAHNMATASLGGEGARVERKRTREGMNTRSQSIWKLKSYIT